MPTEINTIPTLQVCNIGNKKRPLLVIKGFIELPGWSGYYLHDQSPFLKKQTTARQERIELWVDGAITSPTSYQIDQEQENAYHYLVNNQEKIRWAILDKLRTEFPRLLAEEYASWEQDNPDFPTTAELSERFDFKNFIGPQSIHIEEESKDGMAYVTWQFRCRWDVEHGFGVITHKERVIDLSPDIDTGKILEDNGTADEDETVYTPQQGQRLPKKKWWQFW